MKLSPWHVLNSGPRDPAFNMALDEALLKSASRLGGPVLRFYGWTERAASFGYFQKYEEIARLTPLRPLIRRPTGGGLVPHRADWTYSLAFSPKDDWYSLAAVESYRKVHEWIQAAFGQLRIKTELAPDCLCTLPGQCFQGYEKFDLLWHGKKIAGAAQRRTRDGLLIQGSVHRPSTAGKPEDWHKAMCDVAASQFGAKWGDLTADADLIREAEELARQKYSKASYNQKR